MHRYTLRSALREVAFWLLALVFVLPVYFLVALSLETPEEAARSPFALPSHPTLSNYSDAWTQAGGGLVSFLEALVNSAVTTVAAVALLIVVGAPAGYVLARRTTRLSRGVFATFMLGLILPAQLGLVPLFVAMTNSGLGGTRVGLVLVYLGMLLPLSIFLYTAFFRRMPVDYEQAALVDGASRVQVFVDVVLPLMRPVTGTVAVLCGLLVWNDFFTPLTFVGGTDKVTLPVAIYSFVGQYTSQWQLIFASIVIALAPIMLVYLVFQRYIIRGFASGVRG